MDDYVSKPFQAGFILAKLSRLAVTAEEQEVEICPDAPVLMNGVLADLKALMAPEQFCDFVTLCIQGAEGHVAQIAVCAAAGERKGAAQQAHMLVSVAGNVGAMRLSELARRIETAAANEPSALADAMVQLKACLIETLSQLRTEVEAVRRQEGKQATA
jgi:HPt (histidine-containing phosphotransfer) domain-containing protein